VLVTTYQANNRERDEMSETTVYHHIEHSDNVAIKFNIGGLSDTLDEYFVLDLGSVTTFLTRKQSETVISQIRSWFDAEYLNEQARVCDVLSV